MSLSWRDRVVAGIAPGQLKLRREPGLWPRRSAAPVTMACEGSAEPPWRGALDALARVMTDPSWQDASLTAVLSDHFVRYQLVPWQEGVESAAERLAYATFHFRGVYGSSADDWTVRIADAPPGLPAAACAVDTSLLAALHALAAKHRLRLACVQPLWVRTVNRLRREAGRGDGGIALAEAGRLSLGLLQQGTWRALASRSAATPGAALDELLAQESLRAEPPLRPATLHWVGGAPPADSVHGWRLQSVHPDPWVLALES